MILFLGPGFEERPSVEAFRLTSSAFNGLKDPFLLPFLPPNSLTRRKSYRQSRHYPVNCFSYSTIVTARFSQFILPQSSLFPLYLPFNLDS